MNKFRYLLVLKPSEVISRLAKRFHPDAKNQTGYQSATTNVYGDETVNRSDHKGYIRKTKPKPYTALPFPLTVGDRYGAIVIREFAEWCKSHQVKLLAAYPGYMYFPIYEGPAGKLFFSKLIAFYKDLGVPVLGKPYDFMYAKEIFFDNQYHLKGDAADQMTRQLTTLLMPYLEQPTNP